MTLCCLTGGHLPSQILDHLCSIQQSHRINETTNPHKHRRKFEPRTVLPQESPASTVPLTTFVKLSHPNWTSSHKKSTGLVTSAHTARNFSGRRCFRHSLQSLLWRPKRNLDSAFSPLFLPLLRMAESQICQEFQLVDLCAKSIAIIILLVQKETIQFICFSHHFCHNIDFIISISQFLSNLW